MKFNDFSDYEGFRAFWDAVKICRPVQYTLFTFGDSDLHYMLVSGPRDADPPISIRQGTVKISRPLIITANNPPTEFHNFFEDQEDEELAHFLMARTARFQSLQFDNIIESKRFVSDNLEQTVARLEQKLDD